MSRDFDYNRGFAAGSLELETQKALRLEAEEASRLYGSQRDAANKRADEAERQAGELREQRDLLHKQLSACQGLACERLNMIEEGKIKLDTAMGLLIELRQCNANEVWPVLAEIDAFISTTSTEGKCSHIWVKAENRASHGGTVCQACGTEGKDHD